jgi:3-deoxy-manno-octulosonate cytidylyltransferase (CMP-KDO synthetase)
MPKIVGIVPARMAASRFPGKPLHPICGRPLIEHCYLRARLYPRWDALVLATCDSAIANFASQKGWPVIMTSDRHTRALDRIAEAAPKAVPGLADDDIVVCVQGDEPLLGPDVLEAVVAPFATDATIEGTMLAMPIHEEGVFLNPDIVKIVADMNGDVLYTSRAPVPYCKPGRFSPALGAMRVGGIFGFRWHFLKWFTATPESPLEIAEACDSNRICDHGRRQRIAPVPYRPYVSVDSLEDVGRVEVVIESDPLWGRY